MASSKEHPLTFRVECVCGTRRLVGKRGCIFCPNCDSPGMPRSVAQIPPEIKKWDVRM